MTFTQTDINVPVDNTITTAKIVDDAVTSAKLDTNIAIAGTLGVSGVLTGSSLDISGDIDIDGTTNLDVVDIDGALTQDGGAVFNEASADVDFRVESNGNANGLILRGSDGAVGISTSPNAWETGTGGRQPIQVGFGSISGRLNDLHTEFTNNAYAVGTGNSPQWAGITRWSKNQIALGSNGEIYFNTSPAVAENTFNSSPNFSWTNMLTLQSTGATLANGLTLTDGDLTVASGHGINFAATGGPTNGSGNSELLDDYEEGTFTPAFAGSSSNPTVSYQTQQGKYTKIGNLVHVQIRLQTMSVSGGSGNLSITGLPFTSATSSGTGSGFSKAFIYNWSTDPETFFTGGDTTISIYSSDANNTQAQVSHLNTASGPVNYTVIDGTYQV
jgi:hypothetical protein